MRNFFDPILNCTSTSVPLLLIEFTSNGLGIFLNAFATPISKELFGIKKSSSELNSWDTLSVRIANWPLR